jgi:hypothetical protein
MTLKPAFCLVITIVIINITSVFAQSDQYKTGAQLLSEYYGNAELIRKNECCAKQIQRINYKLHNSCKLITNNVDSSTIISKLTFSPKNGEDYYMTAVDIIEAIQAKSFNVLISNIKPDKNKDMFYKIEGTAYSLIVFSQAKSDRLYNISIK